MREKMSPGELARQMRLQRVRKWLRSALIWVVAPTALAALYYSFWATPVFESHATIVVHTENEAPDQKNAEIVGEIVSSRELFEKINAAVPFRGHFANADFLSRLGEDTGSEDALDFYRGKVKVKQHPQSIVLRVGAFSPQMAHSIATEVITHTQAAFAKLTLEPLQAELEVRTRQTARARQVAEGMFNEAPKEATGAFPTAALEREEAVEGWRAAVREQKQLERRIAMPPKLVLLSAPSTPTQASYPKRLWSTATVFVVSLALLSIVSMLGGAIREHARI